VLGALILEPAQQYLTQQVNNSYLSQILLGAVFLLVILLLPRGLIPTAGEKITSWQARRRQAAGTPVADGAVLAGPDRLGADERPRGGVR
jgi:branched-chain amino acid transport system permease protein